MKRKNEKSDNIWDNIVRYMWYFLIGLVFFVCILVFLSKKGYCADSNYPLPFVVNNNVDLFSQYENSVTTGSYNQGASLYNDGVIGWFAWENNYFTQHFMIPVHNNYEDFYFVTYNTGTFEDFDIVFNRLTLNFQGGGTGSSDYTNRKYIHVYFKQRNSNTTGGTYDTTKQATALSKSFGFHASNFYSINYLTTPLKDADGNIIITPAGNGIVGTGHATPPEQFNNPYFNPNSHAQPPEEVPPQVTINNYTWNTYNPPAIDDTDIISTLKSLIYVVNYLAGWFKDNLAGEFQNLLSNLSSFFDYIGQTIQYYGGLIIDNIQNLITTFYNNMVSIGENIAEKVGYISEPFDSSALIDAFEDMQIYDDYDRCGQLIEDAFGFFDDISEPQSFTIPIDLRGISLLHQTQILYLDLGWINSAKNVIRAFMWTVTTFGLLYTVIDSIPDYIQGQDE